MIDFLSPFIEAIQFIADKQPNPQKWNALEWSMKARDVREKSFFSARVENVRFLERGQDLIDAFLGRETETVTNADGVESTMLKSGSREVFVEKMREFMVREGMATDEELRGANQADIRDIKARDRLELIFDTNTAQARGYGYWQQGQSPDVLRSYPAARFIRQSGVETPRPRHQADVGEVRLKSDTSFWADYHNAEEIGGFGTPWPPFGFRSGMWQEDVGRSEAKALGLDVGKVEPLKRKLTDEMKVSTKTMEPVLKDKLLKELNTPKKPSVSDTIQRSIQKQIAQRRAAGTYKEMDGAIVYDSPK